jgi:hypothetical protein
MQLPVDCVKYADFELYSSITGLCRTGLSLAYCKVLRVRERIINSKASEIF